jgi:hypothetical protein
MCTAVYSIPGQSVAVTTATVIGARCEAVNTQLPPLARMTTIPFDMVADPASGRGDFGDFAIQDS